MVNVNELKIGEFYKFIIEEVVDEEKKIVDVMEILFLQPIRICVII